MVYCLGVLMASLMRVAASISRTCISYVRLFMQLSFETWGGSTTQAATWFIGAA